MQAQQTRQKIFTLIYSHPTYAKSMKSELQKIAKKVFTSSQLIQRLKQFSILTYTHRDFPFKKRESTSYEQLQRQYEKELPDLFSDMASLVLEYEAKQPQFPIMYAQSEIQHTFNKKQKLLLMSMMAMSLIPNQDCRFKYKFPSIADFRYMFCEEDYKTTTIMEYFKRQFESLRKLGADYEKQKLTLRRLVQKRSIDNIIAEHKEKPMLPSKIGHDKQSIEQYFGEVKVDFANKFIGGGALGSGCVQEQIMFANHPEMLTSVLFCQVMKLNQAIQFIGYKKYFNNNGYAHTTSYGGEEQHQYEYDQQNRAKQYILAIDALHYPGKRHQSEFTLEKINRELLKAYTGFSKSGSQNSKIVTGNWGCGAFNGNIPLKFVIQWLACSMAGKQMLYTPFGYGDKLKNAQHIQDKICKMKVGEVYKLIQDSEKELYDSRDLFKTLSIKMEEL